MKMVRLILRYVESAAEMIGQHLNSHSVVCTKSTVPIGTGKKIIKIINRSKKTDISFDYISNPEFLREGLQLMIFFGQIV